MANMLSPLATPAATRDVLEEHGLSTKHALGQNFLVNDAILQKIVELAQLDASDDVLEVGPGIGTLTIALLKCAGRVVSVERDADLPVVLEDTLEPWADRFALISKDALELTEEEVRLALAKCAPRPLGSGNGTRRSFPNKFVANLPYAVAATLVLDFFQKFSQLESATVMVQKEVADRMQVGPGTKDYGALSLAVQYYAKPEIVANVPPNCFMPRPKVGSAVIRLTRHKEPPIQVKDEKLMFQIIRASFNQRRKTLANGLNNAGGFHLSKEAIIKAIEELGVSPSIRGEALTLEQFARLSDILKTYES